MAQQPIGLFGLKVLPGEETQLDSMEDVRITNISFGEIVKGSGRTVVRVHHKPVPAFDEDSEDEDEFDDFSEGDEEGEDDEEEDDEDINEKIKGAKAALEGLEADDEDNEDDEDDEEEEEEETFILCSLYPGKREQVTVDLHFSVDDDVRFSISGDNAVEIMGNYLSPGRFDDDPDSDELIDSDDDEEIDSDELEMLEGESDDDEESEEGGDIELELISDDEDDMEEDRLELVDEDIPEKPVSKINGKKRTAEQAEVSMDEDATAPVTDAELAVIAKEMGLDISKLTKNQRKKLNKRLRADDSAAETSTASIAQEKAAVVTKEAGKPAKVAAKETVKKDGKPAAKKTTLPSGVIIEDVKIGSGPQAKAGNRLGMRYVGRLQNGKQFDSNTKGKPFTFKLGKGEVIGGWDQGLRGMQVGGERRLIIPPKQAYGARGAPPDIPGNATLVFDVKLVEIK